MNEVQSCLGMSVSLFQPTKRGVRARGRTSIFPGRTLGRNVLEPALCIPDVPAVDGFHIYEVAFGLVVSHLRFQFAIKLVDLGST